METTAHFTHIYETIIAELQKARQSVYVAVAWFTDRDLFQCLCERAATGIRVKLMLTNDTINFREGGLPFDRLSQAGGQVYIIGSGGEKQTLMHNKFCVIDEQTVITGSFNWSYKARQNHENITITTDAESLARQFVAEFRQLRDRYIRVPDKAPLDLGKVLKRLDLIKTLIALDEPDDLKPHIDKLAQQQLPEDLEKIVALLQGNQFAEAVSRIDLFGKQYTTLTAYVDAELSGLKIEIRILELQVKALEAEKADMEKLLHEFSVQHSLHLGDLILKLLNLRRKQAITDEERTEAETDYTQYSQEYAETRQQPRFELSADEQKELKRRFRKAAQLCHPDVVAKALKTQAESLFNELKLANDRNDLTRVTEILATLERGDTFVSRSETVTEKALLKHERTRLQALTAQLQTEVQALQQSTQYQTVSQLPDWASYFAEKRQQLAQQLEELAV
ncbi:phospholipase D-like domain-containing protein [Spirosoma spitsbergense]|uniref:phospholipase D-like domain-containing protein n=1 Tax=Spirosoma spitsbergense TaxID=431554 RepID=UPI000377704D|nr:phospholipase D-like domain-containing protein [Spirosoma spitsbergense]